jgi:hypothetical protein
LTFSKIVTIDRKGDIIYMNLNASEQSITITRKSLFIAFFIAIVLALGIIAIQMLPLGGQQRDTAAELEDQMASDAAVVAMQLFFNIGVEEGQAAWLDGICEISTDSGCELLSTAADVMWVYYQYQENNIHISAIVFPVGKISETENEQVWQLRILLTESLPGSNKTENMAYVVILKEEGIWKFDRFLLKPEIDSILSHRTLADSLATEQAWY